MNKRQEEMYMEMAEVVAKRSYAKRLQVGCLVVKDNRILSVGYNGTLPGDDNTCEHEKDGILVTKPDVIHAEANAILKMARDGQAAKDAVLFSTVLPCIDCSKMIVASGIKKVYWRNCYRSTDGMSFLFSHNIEVELI